MAEGDRKVYPVLSAGPTLTTGAVAWVNTAYTEVIPASTITTGFAIEAISFLPDEITTGVVSVVVSIGIGPATETEVIQLPISYRFVTAAGYAKPVQAQLSEGYEVAANTRVAIRIAQSGAVAGTFGGFKIVYKELAGVATSQKARPISDTAAGGWTASTGSDLYDMVDEATASDTDYITGVGV